jgi:hypothetical protein
MQMVILLTTHTAAATDDGMAKDKQLQVRVDDEDERMLLELRRAESDLPGKSAMVLRLILRAYADLKKGERK